MRLRQSKKTGKDFWGCSEYPKCDGIAWINEEPKETPKSGGLKKAIGGGNEEVLEALRKIWVEIESLRKEFKEFVRIFGGKQDE